MGDCPSHFGLIPFVLPNPMFVSASDVPPSGCDLVFDRAMDQTVTPATTSIEIKVDGSPDVVISLTWQDSTTLRIDFTTAPTSSVDVTLVVNDNNLRSLEQGVCGMPQTVQYLIGP